MEYQKITNSFDNRNDQPYKFRTKNWVVVNNGANYSTIIKLGVHRNCYGIFTLIYKDANTLSCPNIRSLTRTMFSASYKLHKIISRGLL